MIKAFIFDMDGVIIDSEPVHWDIEQNLFKEYNIEVTEEDHQSFIGATSYYMWDRIKNKYNLSHTLEELVQRDRSIYLDYLNSDKDIKPIDGVDELIKYLSEKGVKLAVASSSPLNVIQTVMKVLKLDKYFDVLVTGDEVEKSKPEPDIFLRAAQRLNVKPEECIVIEDSCNGARAAKKAGMKCIGYKNLNSGNQDLSNADLIQDSFYKVKEYLGRKLWF